MTSTTSSSSAANAALRWAAAARCLARRSRFERLNRPRQPVGRALLNKETPVEQHPHRLDCVQRDAFGPSKDTVAYLRGKPRHETGQELLHRLPRQRLQVERSEAALPGAPGGP